MTQTGSISYLIFPKCLIFSLEILLQQDAFISFLFYANAMEKSFLSQFDMRCLQNVNEREKKTLLRANRQHIAIAKIHLLR